MLMACQLHRLPVLEDDRGRIDYFTGKRLRAAPIIVLLYYDLVLPREAALCCCMPLYL